MNGCMRVCMHGRVFVCMYAHLYVCMYVCIYVLPKNLKIKIYRTVILPVVLYGCETWSLTLREEHRLRVSENRVLRRILGPKRDEEWRKLHNEEPNDMYSTQYC
jgi:hypothetical protein